MQDLVFTPMDDPFLKSLTTTTSLGANATDSFISSHSTLSNGALQQLVYDSLSAMDVDVRKEMCSNIVLVGASSLFPNFQERLSEELSSRISPTFFKPKVIASKPLERQFSSWIGASVLTSLGSFQQMWCSRAEYEEYGATLAATKFPS
jgi:actin-related protein